MKKKLFMIFIFIFIVSSVCVGTLIIKETYSVEETDVNVTFDYRINVDETNKIIKYLNHKLTVGELKKKIDTSKLKNPSIKVMEKDENGNFIEEIDGDKFSTGSILEIYDEGTKIASYTLSVLGDFTGGYEINEKDIEQLFWHYRGNKIITAPEKILAGNVKFGIGNISTESNIELTVGDRYVIDYIVHPEEEPKITLADVAKLYQYQQGKLANLDYYLPNESVNRGEIVWSTDNNKVVVTPSDEDKSVNDGVVEAKYGGAATIFGEYNGVKHKTLIKVTNPNKIYHVNQFLTTNGNKIVQKKDSKTAIQLKGYNVGSWLSISNTFLPFQSTPQCKFNRCEKHKPSESDSEEVRKNKEILYEKCEEECENEYGVGPDEITATYSCINGEYIEQAIYKNISKEDINGITYDKNNDVVGNESYNTMKNTIKVFYENYMTEQDFDMIAQTGANLIRLPIEFDLFYEDYDGDGVYNERSDKEKNEAVTLIKEAVKMAADRGIYTIFSLHVVPGRQNNGGYCIDGTFLNSQFDADNIEKDKYTEKYNRSLMVNLWGYLAEEFYNEPAIAGYDLLNEPQGNYITTPIKYRNLIEYYDAAYAAIRQAEDKMDVKKEYPNHIIIMEETCVYCGANRNNIYEEKEDHAYSDDSSKFALTIKERNAYKDMIGALPAPTKTTEQEANYVCKNIIEENPKATPAERLGACQYRKLHSWENVVYSTHDYVEDTIPDGNGKPIASVKNSEGGIDWNLQSKYTEELKSRFEEKFLKEAKKIIIDYNIPLFVGEFSMFGENQSWLDQEDGSSIESGSSKGLWEFAFDVYNGNFEGIETKSVDLDRNGNGKIEDNDNYKETNVATKEAIVNAKDSISYAAWNYKGHFEPYLALVYYGSKPVYISNQDLNDDKNVDIKNSLEKIKYGCSNASLDKSYLVYDTTEKVLVELSEKKLCKLYQNIFEVQKGNMTINISEIDLKDAENKNKVEEIVCPTTDTQTIEIKDTITGEVVKVSKANLCKILKGTLSVSGTPYKVNLESDSQDVIETVFSYKSSNAMRFNKNFYDVFINKIGNDRIANEITITPLVSDKMKSDKMKYNIGMESDEIEDTMKEPCDLTLKKGDNTYLNYEVTNAKAINKGNTIWTSDSVAVTIDKNTGKITAKDITGVKAATITLTIPAYEYTAADKGMYAQKTFKICVVDK